MKDQDKTKEELITELLVMRQGIAALDASLVALMQREEVGQEAERTCKAMIEAFDGHIYVCSPNYEVQFMNERFIQRTGYFLFCKFVTTQCLTEEVSCRTTS